MESLWRQEIKRTIPSLLREGLSLGSLSEPIVRGGAASGMTKKTPPTIIVVRRLSALGAASYFTNVPFVTPS